MSQTTATNAFPLLRVKTLSGHSVELKGEAEAKFYKSAQDKYMHDFSFTVASDLRSLDRLVFLETMIFRYQMAIGSGFDANGEEISSFELADMRKALREASSMASDVQRDLGLTVAQREKEKFDSVGQYITNLKNAAKQFGIHREKQLGVALEVMNEIFAEVGAFRRSNDNERAKLGKPTADAVLQWIDDTMRDKYDAVDEYFRENQQRYWVGTL